MKRSYLLKPLCMIMLLVCQYSLVGCTSKKTAEPSVTPRDTLVFRITWKAYSGRGEAIQKIVSSYNASQPDRFEINMIDGDEDYARVEALLNGNSPVDIYVLPYRFAQYFGHKGKLMDLSKDFEKEKGFFYQNLWELGEVDRKTYGIPWVGHSMCLLYNKTILQKAEVDPGDIKSIDALAAACEKVEAQTEARGIGLVGANHNDVSWMVNQFVYGFGSQLVDKEGKRVMVNNAKTRSAIDFYKNILGRHAQNNWVNDTGVEAMDCFRKQQVAFEFQGIWGVTDIWKNGRPFEVGVIPLEDIGLPAEVGPMMLALPADLNPAKREAATDFINYMISRQAQERIMNGEYSPEHDAYYPFRTPVRKDLADSLVFQNYPEFVPFLAGFENPSIDVPVPGWQKIKEQYYAPGLHQVMAGNVSIEEFLQTVEIEGNKILQEASSM